MPEALDRRGFLQHSGLLVAAAGLGLAGLAGTRPGVAKSTLQAAEPIARTGVPKFKFSLAAYSYRQLLSGEKPELTLHDFLADCARMQLDGAELTSYYFPKDFEPGYLRELKHTAFRLGLDVSGTAVRNEFCHPPGPQRDQERDYMRRWIEHAEILGAPVIRIFSGRPQGQQTHEEAHRLAVQGMEEAADYAGQHGVFLGLENHGGLTTRIDDLLRLVRDVNSPWFGINFDSGNFQACSTADEAYADMEKMAPYAVNAQIKVAIALRGGKVESDFRRIAKIMQDAGYRGYIVLEFEEKGDPREECPKHIAELREAFA